MNRTAVLSALTLFAMVVPARCDTTIVEVMGASAAQEVPIELKGNLMRVKDPSGPDTTIMDIRNEDSIILMPSVEGRKRFIRVPGKFMDPFPSPSPFPKPSPTGKKETVNGFETEEYVRKTSAFTAIFSVAINYPDYASVARAMIIADLGGGSSAMRMACPDYRDLPGVPIRVRLLLPNNVERVTTVASLKHDPLPDSDFQPPPDYTEMTNPIPDLHRIKIPVPPLFPTPTPTATTKP